MTESGVERHYLHCDCAVDEAHAYLPGIAAHFAVLNVLLKAAPAGIDTDLDGLTAVRADYICRAFRCRVAQRKLLVEIA